MDLAQQVKQSIDLAKYISRFADLKRSGSVWQGKCIFHRDGKSPSLTVWDNGSWKCFGCGAGGDIYDFLILKDGFTFTQAFNKLCEETNTDASGYIPCSPNQYLNSLKKAKKSKEINLLPELSQDLLEKYCQQQHKTIIEKWEPETIEKFKIGFCTNTNDELYGRITIPIFDEYNRLVGFSGRAVREESSKYHFLSNKSKGDILYNLNFALPYIKEKKQMIIVEGYKDIWRCWEAEVKNVVALMGNLATEEQVKLIKKYGCFNLVLALDNDKGGAEGILKLKKELKYFCRIQELEIPNKRKDLGECTVEEIRRVFNV